MREQIVDTLREAVAWLVAVVGLFGWIMFIPQIRLLLKAKEAKSISLGLIWGSFVAQSIIALHAVLQRDWHLTFAIATSLTCLAITLFLIYYYRRYPGGR